jgi:hypothetical protein
MKTSSSISFFFSISYLFFSTSSLPNLRNTKPCDHDDIIEASQAGAHFVASSVHASLPNYSQTLSPHAYFTLHRCMRQFSSLKADNIAMVIISNGALIQRVRTQSSMWGKDAADAGAHVFYFSESAEPTLGNLITVLDDEGAKGLTKVGADHRSLRGLQYVLRTLSNTSLEWIFMADDDTYYDINELLALARPFRSDLPVLISHQFRGRMRWTGTYDSHPSGGAGMLLSITAAKMIASAVYTDNDQCKYVQANDVTISRCSRSLKIPQVHFHSMQPDWDGFSAMPSHAIESHSELGGAVSAHRLVPVEWFKDAFEKLHQFFKPPINKAVGNKLCFDLRGGNCQQKKR